MRLDWIYINNNDELVEVEVDYTVTIERDSFPSYNCQGEPGGVYVDVFNTDLPDCEYEKIEDYIFKNLI
jgi:hypothetical protein